MNNSTNDQRIRVPDPGHPEGQTVPDGPSIDRWIERGTVSLSQNTSRRGFLTTLGKALIAAVGIQLVPFLPSDRIAQGVEAGHTCSYWGYCGIFAPRLCFCCTNQHCACPYGTTPGSMWSACCNGTRVYYWDCCRNGTTPQCNNPDCACRVVPSPNYCSGGTHYYCTTACLGGSCS